MSNPKVSVIVPVYNAERYLHRCVDSILAQDFTSFELLLIDDGSKDKSGEICDEYARNDPRVKVFHNQWGGVSLARNTGLDNAQGEWVTFVDSDDYISPDFLSSMVDEDVDLVVGQSRHFDSEGKPYMVESIPAQLFMDESQMRLFLSEHLVNHIMRTLWGKLYRRAKTAGVRFDSSLRIGEDTVFVERYLLGCKSISVVAAPVYYYFTGEKKNVKYSMSPEDGIYHLKKIVGQYRELNVKCLRFEEFIFGFMLSLCVDNMEDNTWFRDKFIVGLIKSFRALLPKRIYWKYQLMRLPLFFHLFINGYR